MSLRIHPTGAPFGAFVSGIDLGNVSRGDVSELYRAFLEYGLLVFKGMNLDVAEHIKLGSYFGEMNDPYILSELHLKEEPRIAILAANGGVAAAADDPEADTLIGKIPWHSDTIFTPYPNRGALLRAVVIPEKGGNTGWIDTTRVYRSLPYAIKCRIQDLRIIHSHDLAHSKQNMVKGGVGAFPDAIHPLVSLHPETDQPILNISPASAKRLVGLPEKEATALLDELIGLATRDEEAYVHEWQPGDIVAWDNLRAIHRAFGHPKRHPRVMHSLVLKPEMKLGRLVANDDSLAGEAAA